MLSTDPSNVFARKGAVELVTPLPALVLSTPKRHLSSVLPGASPVSASPRFRLRAKGKDHAFYRTGLSLVVKTLATFLVPGDQVSVAGVVGYTCLSSGLQGSITFSKRVRRLLSSRRFAHVCIRCGLSEAHTLQCMSLCWLHHVEATSGYPAIDLECSDNELIYALSCLGTMLLPELHELDHAAHLENVIRYYVDFDSHRHGFLSAALIHRSVNAEAYFDFASM